MTTNILIGVGGTGAKVVEAVLHAAAAGLGPDALRVGFVDQDQSNGNVGRSLQTLNTLIAARDAWRVTAAQHKLGEESDLLRTDIGPISAAMPVWVPQHGQAMSLSRIFGSQSAEDRLLFDQLFAKGASEQDMILDEGFRGRPHIGSAAISSRVDDEDEFWKSLLQLIRQSQAGADVRLLFAGSVFGGTGAAGFPTLARLIRKRLAAEKIQRNIAMGGLLMLPYFGFDPPPSDEGLAGNVARSEQLLIQSRGALKYYDALFRHEHVFDELYLVGWNRPFELGYHSPGAKNQENPALPPELIAAMAVCRFYNPKHAVVSDGTNQVFVCARKEDNAISWSDLPSPVSNDPTAPYRGFGRLLRFAVAWKYWRSIIAQPRGFLARMVQHDPWFRSQGVKDVDFRNADPSLEVQRLSAYLDHFLVWAAANQAYTGRSNMSFGLWRVDDVLAENVNFAKPTDPIRVKGDLSEDDYARCFNSIVIPKAESEAPPSANELLVRLNGAPFEGGHKGLGRIAGALHAYSAVVGART